MLPRLTLTATVFAALALATGCVGAGDESAADEPFDSAEQAVEVSSRQFASYYLKNALTSDGRTQWSSVVIDNPGSTPATVTLTIHRNDGSGTLAALSKIIPARGQYNSYTDPAWLGVTETDPVNHRSSGWVELTSDVPVIATNRVTLRTGATYDSPVSLLNDAPFLKLPPTEQQVSTFFLRNWPSGSPGITQWTDVTVNNPGSVPANITVYVRKVDGSGDHATLSRTVPAHGAWSSFSDPDWLAIPPTDAGTGGAMGWIDVRSDVPVVASSRLAMRSGSTYNAPPVLLDDTGFESRAARTLRAPLALRGWPAGGSITQWSHPVLVNPSSDAATITVVVRRTDGSAPDLASFTRTLPSGSQWSAFSDPDWTSISSGAIGWAEITSDQPIVGVNRLMLRNGSTASSPFTLFDDEPLAQAASGTLFASMYMKRGATTAGYTQWTDLVVNNPLSSSATITVRIQKVDGSGDLATFSRQIPGYGAWRTEADPQWLALPDSDPAGGRSVGWVEITSTAPVTGLSRLTLREGDTASSPVALFEDAVLEDSRKLVYRSCDGTAVSRPIDPSCPACSCQ